MGEDLSFVVAFLRAPFLKDSMEERRTPLSLLSTLEGGGLEGGISPLFWLIGVLLFGAGTMFEFWSSGIVEVEGGLGELLLVEGMDKPVQLEEGEEVD